MTDLLLITDADGTLLFRSREATVNHAVCAALAAAAKAQKRGLISVGNRRTYVKEVPLQGRRHLFFLDFDRLCTRFGTAADRAAEGLFDVSTIAAQPRRTVSLRVLCRLFAEGYGEILRDAGVHPSLRVPVGDLNVSVPPNAFTLCLALLLRLGAGADGGVQVRFVRECGRVTVFADGEGKSPLSAGEREVLTMLLYEVSGAVGFAAEMRQSGCGCSLSLALDPLDISLLGFKTDVLARYKNTMLYYISLFG